MSRLEDSLFVYKSEGTVLKEGHGAHNSNSQAIDSSENKLRTSFERVSAQQDISGNIQNLSQNERATPNDSSFQSGLFNCFGKSFNLALQGLSEIKEKEKTNGNTLSESEEPRLYTIEEQNAGFMKHILKIKYFWRGTNFNYPYAFHRFSKINHRIKKLKKMPHNHIDESYGNPRQESEASLNLDDDSEYYLLLEDYSNKHVNPSEKLYK